MFRKKKIINFLLLVLVFSIITFSSRYSFAKSLTNDELLSVKNNGIVSAMCYVNNLLTGPVAKAIMAVSVLGIGWLFLLGGASWITVLMFTIASSLVFGGIELANLISGNTYSCKTFQEAQEKYDDLIYNKGVCSLHEITDVYSSGQLWKKCFGSADINSSNVDSLCREDITNNTEINEPDKIILYGCQEGYLKKNRDNYLSYTCKLDNNEVGYFSPKKKGESGDTNNYDMATCLKACKLTDLKNTYKNFNLRPTDTDNDGNTKIIANNGYIGYLEGGYYSQGTKLDVTCKDGFIISMRDENGVCSSDADLGFICGENAIFTLKKACQIACDLKKVNSKIYVAKWHEKSVETCRPNGLNEDMYISGDILDAQTCEDGYDFEYKKDGTAIIIECSSSGDWMNNGKTCHKTCLKQDLLNKIPGNRLIGCSDTDDENCDVNINNRDKFQYQEVVSVTDSCESGFSIYKTSGEKLARYICGYNGVWENTNYGSLLCERNCDITAEDNRLTGRDNTQSWLIYNSTSEKYEDLKTNILTNGQRIKPKTCKEGSNVFSDGAAEFICDNGRFNFAYAGDVNEYCKPGCKFKELKNLTYIDVDYDTTLSSKSWIICTENGIENTEGGALFGSLTEVDLLTGTDREKFARVGTFYKIKECNSSYNIISRRSDSLVVKCDNSGSWIISNEYGWNFCRLYPHCYEVKGNSSNETASIEVGTTNLNNILVKLQLWGAPGGGIIEEDSSKSNLGGYSYGEISVKGGDLLYINVGEKGKLSSKTNTPYNGGGYSAYVTGVTSSSGGGATDIRYGGTGLDNRVLVAGGGGGSISINGTNHYGHKGGGLFENTTAQTDNTEGIDGSSVFLEGSKFINKLYNSFITTGVKGVGGNSLVYYLNNTTPVISSGGGGGGGYYGGSGGANAGGGGGSGFIDSKIIQNGITVTTNEGPTDGGFARVCWGDWYGLKNPCESDYEDETSHQENAGIGAFIDIDETVTCVAPEVANNPIRDQELSGIGRCSRESLKEILIAKHAKLPQTITDDMLPDYYYEGMIIRNQCESGYDITDGDDQNRIEFTCSKDNSWTVKGGCSLKPGCYEFTSSGTGKKLDFSTVHNDISEIQLQAWGAPGGTTINKPNITYGGYSKGTLRLTNNNKVIYVVVGGKGGSTTTKGLSSARGLGGFNGGGDGGSNQCKNCSSFAPGAGGGGATDIRYGGLALNNRVMVAGGAGGNSGHTNNTISGKGGGTSGGNGNNSTYGATGGTQNNGGANGTVNEYNDLATSGVLGQGGHGTGYVPNTNHTYYGWQYGAGGGGGYYGGGGSLTEGSGGGSGYIGGVVDGSTTTVSSGPTDGGFVRICWGDWAGQTNPCSVTNHNSNAGITTNSTKCTLNPSLTNATPGTLNTCSRTSLLTAFTNANVRQPNNAAANLPDKYYEGMKVRGDCNSSYIIVGGNNGKVEFSCQSNGTWSKSGECGVLIKYISITDSSKYNEKIFTPGTNVTCNNATFGDPYGNIGKYCMIGNTRVAYEGDSFVASINAEATKKCHKYYINAGTNVANSNFNNTSYTGIDNAVANNGVSVDLSCNTGYVSVQAKATCNNGTWKYSGSCVTGCSRADLNSKISGHAGSQLYPNATAPTISGTQYNSYNHFAFNTMVEAACASGYTEVSSNGEINSEWGYHAYKCVNEDGRGVWKRMGSCIRACVGKPTLITGSKFYISGSNIGNSGTFYLNGNVTAPNDSNVSNIAAAHGAILDANCKDGYTEVKDGGTCKALVSIS